MSLDTDVQKLDIWSYVKVYEVGRFLSDQSYFMRRGLLIMCTSKCPRGPIDSNHDQTPCSRQASFGYDWIIEQDSPFSDIIERGRRGQE